MNAANPLNVTFTLRCNMLPMRHLCAKAVSLRTARIAAATVLQQILTEAAGVFDGPLRGHHAFDSDLHKAMEGAMYSLQHHDDPALRQRVEGILDRILAAQQEDGFLTSYFIVNGLKKRWDDMRLEQQMYNAGHFFEMAVAHHRLSGDARALDAAQRFADHIIGIFGPGKRYDVGGHEEIELALIKLYRATGEQRYLDLARFLLDERGHAHGTERRPFTRGPLVVPERQAGQTDVFKLSLPRKPKLSAEHRQGLLGGVTVLRGTGLDDQERRVGLTAVPCYESTAAQTAVSNVKRFVKLDRAKWVDARRKWWHEYYPKSFVSIPDTGHGSDSSGTSQGGFESPGPKQLAEMMSDSYFYGENL